MSKLIHPRQSAKIIASKAVDVTINEENARKIAEKITDVFRRKEYKITAWKEHVLHPKEMEDKTIDWIFLADSLNFSFWCEPGAKYGVNYNGKLYTGYLSLQAAIRRALDEGVPIFDPKYYATIEREKFDHFLRSDTEVPMPLLDERYQVMRETGKILNEKFNSSFVNCVKSCNQSADKLLELVVNNFPSYRDEADFNGTKVTFYKRAQILIGDIWSCFEGENQGKFNDIDTITIFADYRVPQVLNHFGVMEYTDRLNERLKNKEMLINGEQQEVEIRGCSVHAIEIINEMVKSNLKAQNAEDILVNSVLLDYYFWDYRQANASELDVTPFHRTRSIYY